MRYELLNLDRLATVFISIYSAAPEEEYIKWTEQVRSETDRVKSRWQVVASQNLTEAEMQHFVNCREEGLLALIRHCSVLPPAFQNKLYPSLEELVLYFIRLFPACHHSMERKIPLDALQDLRKQCRILYRQARSALKAQKIPSLLAETLLRPLQEIDQPEARSIGFGELLFLTQLKCILQKQIRLPYDHHEPGLLLIRRLCYINYNSLQLVRRLEDYISKRLEEIDHPAGEKKFLLTLQADLHEATVIPYSQAEPESRPLHVMLTESIRHSLEEREELSSFTGAENDGLNNAEIQEDQVICQGVSLEVLGLLYRLKVSSNGIRLKKKTARATFELMARVMRTTDKGVLTPFTAHSLAQKFYVVSESAIRSTDALLKKMLRCLKEIEKNKKQGLPLPKIKYY